MEYVKEGNKKYRIGHKYAIRYFKKLPEDGVCTLYINLKDSDNTTNEASLIINGNKYVLQNSSEGYRVLGFLQTTESNVYVGILAEKNLLPLWLIGFLNGVSLWFLLTIMGVFAITSGIFISSYLNKDKGKVNFEVPYTAKESTGDEDIVPYSSEPNVDVSKQKSTIIDAIVYEGEYLELYPSDVIPLGNNPENKGICLQYIIKDASGSELYVSDKLNPGESINWQPTKYLNNGKQDIVITVNVYHKDTGMQDVGTDMYVKFNIHK